MGRELKRVPLNFDAPIRNIYKGYINPHYVKCSDCKNGYTAAGRAFEHLVRLLMMAGSDSLNGEMHPWLREAGVESLSPDMAELTSGLAGRLCRGGFMGHDSSDDWAAVKKIREAAGVDEKWGVCKTCDGNAVDPAHYEAYEAWKPEELPTGEGYQLWETTSEGSPISPVFADLASLCEYASENCSVFGSHYVTAAEWRKMLDEDFVRHEEVAPNGNTLVFI